MKQLIYFLLISCTFLQVAVAQTDSARTLWQVETTDGNIYLGEKVQETDLFVELDTEALGVIQIAKSTIMLMRTVDEKEAKRTKAGKGNDAQATRYLFSPNAYNLRKGQGYYQNTWVFYNQVSVGITDNISIGGGLVPLFLFGVGAPTPVFITPKVSIPINRDKVNVAAGALIGGVVGEDVTDGFAGIAYGVSTFGSRTQNLTVGIGYGFAGQDFTQTPLLTISGITKIGKRSYLLTENYLIPNGGGGLALLSGGGRWVGDAISIDYGLFVAVSDFGGAFPWLSLTVPFGNKE